MMEWKNFSNYYCEAFDDLLKHSGLVNQCFLKAHITCLALVRSVIHIGTDLKPKVLVVFF
jgi:hypothetical protein